MKNLESICIIDDDHIFVYGVKRLIHEVKLAEDLMVYENAVDALDEIRTMAGEGKSLPRVIFLDLNMPMMNGWEFLDEFLQIDHKDTHQTWVYIMSSSVNPQDLMRINNYSIVKNYILKPVTAEDLENILEEVA